MIKLHNKEFRTLNHFLTLMLSADQLIEDFEYFFSDDEINFLTLLAPDGIVANTLPHNYAVITGNNTRDTSKNTIREIQNNKNHQLYSNLKYLYDKISNNYLQILNHEVTFLHSILPIKILIDDCFKNKYIYTIMDSIIRFNYEICKTLALLPKFDDIYEYFIEENTKRISSQAHLKRKLNDLIPEFIKLYYITLNNSNKLAWNLNTEKRII